MQGVQIKCVSGGQSRKLLLSFTETNQLFKHKPTLKLPLRDGCRDTLEHCLPVFEDNEVLGWVGKYHLY